MPMIRDGLVEVVEPVEPATIFLDFDALVRSFVIGMTDPSG